jgi:hypothetical protein
MEFHFIEDGIPIDQNDSSQLPQIFKNVIKAMPRTVAVWSVQFGLDPQIATKWTIRMF